MRLPCRNNGWVSVWRNSLPCECGRYVQPCVFLSAATRTNPAVGLRAGDNPRFRQQCRLPGTNRRGLNDRHSGTGPAVKLLCGPLGRQCWNDRLARNPRRFRKRVSAMGRIPPGRTVKSQLATTSGVLVALSTSAAFGVLNTLIGVGMIVGTQLLTRFAQHVPQQNLVVYGLGGMGVAVLITAAFGTMASTAAGMLGLGFCAAAIFITATTLIQQETPHELLGRVMSCLMSLVAGSQVIAMFVAGPVAEKIGIPNLYYGSAAMLVGIGVVGYFKLPKAENRRQGCHQTSSPSGVKISDNSPFSSNIMLAGLLVCFLNKVGLSRLSVCPLFIHVFA